MVKDGSIFGESPLSFNSYSCDNFAEIAAKVCEEFVDDRLQLGLEPLHREEENDNEKPVEEEKDDLLEEEDDEFEFCFLSGGDGIEITGADEIFSNGQIRPVFPIFNRDLLFAGGKDYYNEESKQPKKINSSLRKLFIGEKGEEEEEEDAHSCSSSEAEEELDNFPAGTYCVWKPKPTKISSPSPDTCKKSKSTGSSSSSPSANTSFVSKRWRLRDFLFRSNSDGKNTFVFLTPPVSTSTSTSTTMLKNRKEEEKLVIEKKLEKVVVSGEAGKIVGKRKLKTGEVSAHEIHYVRNRALKENDRKKSYLPYRQDLVCFFSGGLTRNQFF